MTLRHIINRYWNPSTAQIRDPLSRPLDTLPYFVRQSAVARRYHGLLSRINWQNFPERDLDVRGRLNPTPYRPFVAACLVKIDQQQRYMSHLRTYLVEHPELVYLLGFPLMDSRQFQWGYDADKSLPTARHMTRLLRTMPNAVCQFLLDESVRLLRDELREVAPDFGEVISLDTKHILAWVKENNPRSYQSDRFNKDKQPTGDKDCKLGCKKRHNQTVTPTNNPVSPENLAVGEFHWGYASGIVATKVPGWGEFVLAELTQPFDKSDISYFFPLMAATEQRLGFKPRFGGFDAAFDAFYIYAYFQRDGQPWQHGFAAIPFSKRNGSKRSFNALGDPKCEAGYDMRLKFQFTRRSTRYEHLCDHYICPLKGTAQDCPIQHTKWRKGGCTTRLPSGAGSRVRHQIDRETDLYHSIYNQRTATERLNAQAKELGIERPYLRNQQSITNQNTLIYVVMNLQALRRVTTQLTAH